MTDEKDKPAHSGPLRGLDHALTDIRFVGEERWRDIEDRVDSVEGGVHAGPVAKIADGHVRGAVRPHLFSVGRPSYKSADLGATLGKRRKHESGKFAGRADCEDGRLCVLHMVLFWRVPQADVTLVEGVADPSTPRTRGAAIGCGPRAN